MAEADIRTAFIWQARGCRTMGAPFNGRLMDVLAAILDRETSTGRAVLDWAGDPYADALMMRLGGGLNALVRDGQLPELAACYPPNPAPDDAVFATALTQALADDRLLNWLTSAPQTNEVARSGVLMAGMLVVAQATRLPLALFELGASAGLNLNLDRFGYDLGGKRFGDLASPLQLAPAWKGPPPPDTRITVASRRGVDLSPLDASDAATQARLLAFVWPEQLARIERLQAAIDIATRFPPPLEKADAADWVEAHVRPAEGVTTLVYHSIAHQYFPASVKARIAAHMDKVGATASAAAPLAWLRYEVDSPEEAVAPSVRLRLWPGGDHLLGSAHPHGASVRWTGL